MKSQRSVFALCLTLVFLGCATTGTFWWRATRANTVDAYRDFLQKYPDSRYTVEARHRIEELDWQAARSLNSVDAYERFVMNYPESPHRPKADSLIEELDWKQAQAGKGLDAYQGFVRKHPSSRYRSLAETRIEELEWQQATAENRIEAYQTFLTHHPESRFGDQARARIEELEYDRVRVTNTIETYEDFLVTHKDGGHSDAARSGLQKLRDQIRVVEAATREVLSAEARVEVTTVSQFPRKPQVLISAHLLEGHSPDENSPYVRGDYTTNEKLARLVRLRSARIIRSVASRANLPDASILTVKACHGVRQHINSWATPGTDVAMTLYRVAIPLDTLRANWSDNDLESIIKLWVVDEDITQQVRISTEFFRY